MSRFTPEEVERLLISQGIRPDLAKKHARLEFGLPEEEPEPARDERVLEREEQAEIVKLLKAFRFRVYSTSQYRASKVSLGFPDLWCMHEMQPLAFWFEVKRQSGGMYYSEQTEFGEFAVRCGVGYHTGDRYHAADLLRSLGLALPGTCYPPEPITLDTAPEAVRL